MGPIGEQIMEIAYDEYVKANGPISFDEWFERIAIQSDDFDEKFEEARKIYSQRSKEKELNKIALKEKLQEGVNQALGNDDILQQIMDSTPLETKFRVLNEMFMMTLLTEMGYRKDQYWTDDEEEKFDKLIAVAKELTNAQLQDIEEHIQKHGFTNIREEE